MIILTIAKGNVHQSYILKERLTMKLAKWLASGLMVQDHPLAGVLPKTRFKSYCINTQGKKWVIMFSRKADPTYVMVRGRKVGIFDKDKAHIQLEIEEVPTLDLAYLPEPDNDE